MKRYTCNYCDPKHFTVYGFCRNCSRKCEPPIFDPEGTISYLDYEKIRESWNNDRPDLINDSVRRLER